MNHLSNNNFTKESTVIALDFDQTYTEYPELWNRFVCMCKDYGIPIKFVTYRDSRWGNHDIEWAAELLGLDIIYTAGKQKQRVVDAKIWIDDSCECIPDFMMLGKQYDYCLEKGDMGG